MGKGKLENELDDISLKEIDYSQHQSHWISISCAIRQKRLSAAKIYSRASMVPTTCRLRFHLLYCYLPFHSSNNRGLISYPMHICKQTTSPFAAGVLILFPC
jgi:hypothetical protein